VQNIPQGGKTFKIKLEYKYLFYNTSPNIVRIYILRVMYIVTLNSLIFRIERFSNM